MTAQHSPIIATASDVNLHDFDFVILNSSGGKDSLCAHYEVDRIATAQGYPKEQIIVSHQDLGNAEWAGTKELVQQQCDLFGHQLVVVKRQNAEGYQESLLEYVERRGKWPSSTMRYCTSDFKRGPGAKVVTGVTKGLKD